MKTAVLVIISTLIIQSSYSYILFTANMEDVQALAKQVASSPVVDQLSKIWRRAANQFQRELKQTRRRGDSDTEDETEEDQYTKKIIKNIVAFGKDMGYLGPIKRALEVIDPK